MNRLSTKRVCDATLETMEDPLPPDDLHVELADDGWVVRTTDHSILAIYRTQKQTSNSGARRPTILPASLVSGEATRGSPSTSAKSRPLVLMGVCCCNPGASPLGGSEFNQCEAHFVLATEAKPQCHQGSGSQRG